MIDWLVIQTDLRHEPVGTRYKFLPKDRAANEGHAWIESYIFDGALDGIELHSLYGGAAVELRLCPGKVFQGQNVFGTNNVHAIVMNTLECVASKLGVPLSSAQRKHFDSGAYTVLGLHITEMMELRHSEIPALLQHLVSVLPKSCAAVRKSEGESIEFRSLSKNASISLYDKLSEIENKKKSPKMMERLTALLGKVGAIEAFKFLSLVSTDNLRVEIKFHRQGLRNLDLSSGKAWRRGSTKLARELFKAELDAMDFGRYSSMRRSEILDGLENEEWSLRGIVAVWLLGEDPRRNMTKRTFDKGKKVALDKHRIDLEANPPQLLRDVKHIKLENIFSADNIVKRPRLPNGLEALWNDGEDLADEIREKNGD